MSYFIIAFCCSALLYWVRYSAAQIVRDGSARDQAQRVAEANKLEFERIRERLEASDSLSDDLHLFSALRHDYFALTYLLRYAATVEIGNYSRQERMLILDFHMMRLVYQASRRLSPRAARYALLQMSYTLEYFASVMSRRMNAFSASMLRA